MRPKRYLKKIARKVKIPGNRKLTADLLWHLRKSYGSRNVNVALRNMRINHPEWPWERRVIAVSAQFKARHKRK